MRRWLSACLLVQACAAAPAMADWLPAERISPDGVIVNGILSNEVRVAVDQDGDAVAAWGVGIPGYWTLGFQTRARPAGGPWGPPATLDAAALPGLGNLELGITPGGTAVAGWSVRSEGPEERIRSATRPPNGAWSAPADGPEGRVDHLVVAPDGSAIAMWDLTTAIRGADGAWSPAETITNGVPGSELMLTGLAIDRGGNASAAWSSRTCQAVPTPGPGFDSCTLVGIQAVTRPAGGAWTPSQLLPGTDGPSTLNPTVIARPPSGSALTVVPSAEGAKVWTSPPGGTWTADTATLGAIFMRGALGNPAADVDIDAGGNLLAVWSFARPTGFDPVTGQARPGIYGISAATRAPDGTWSEPQVLAELPGGPPLDVELAVGALGGAIAAWTDPNDGRLRAAVRRPGAAWSAPAILSAANREVFRPRVAVDADGDGVVTWEHEDEQGSGTYGVYAAVHDAGPPPPGPAASAPRCGTAPAVPAGAGGDERGARIVLSAGQLRTNQRIGQAAIRRLNAVGAWLDAGIERRDLCGGAIGAPRLASAVATTFAPAALAEPSAPNPRPVTVAAASEEGGSVRLAASQLLINQRIYQAAIRRATALEQRLDGKLTGGDLANGALGQDKLAQRLLVLNAGTSPEPAQSRTVIPERTGEGGAGVELSAAQLRINQRIAQAAVRRANALVSRLEAGLTGAAFAPGSITAADLAPGLPNLNSLTEATTSSP